MTETERIARLERVVLGLAAMITGEAAAVTTPEEFEKWQDLLAEEMREMAESR